MEKEKTTKEEFGEIQEFIETGKMMKAARIKGGRSCVRKKFFNKTQPEISEYMSMVRKKMKIPKEMME